jgi:molybdenum cofactor cytidylyltransferase
MGAVKPLLDIDGRPSLTCVLDAIDEAAIPEVVVVLGHDADRIRARVDLDRRRVVRNAEPQRGLSTSLALGLAAVPAACSGVLVFHADMPFIQPSTVRAVRSLAESGAVLAAPRLGEARGFPVYFARECFASLSRELSGDTGGRGYIERHSDVLRLVDVVDLGCLRDIDRAQDLVATEGRSHWTTSE